MAVVRCSTRGDVAQWVEAQQVEDNRVVLGSRWTTTGDLHAARMRLLPILNGDGRQPDGTPVPLECKDEAVCWLSEELDRGGQTEEARAQTLQAASLPCG